MQVEDAARDHVYHLRTRDLPLHTHGPSNYVLTPLLTKLDQAVAAVLEHLTDVGGGVEGITYTHAILTDYAMRLPGGGLIGSGGESPALDISREVLNFESLARPEAPTPIS
ncbi:MULTISPECIES: hypothetical protein [unclassified Microbacterium]|uniref:hypothetical protein n=1 Tax=unclassified Microbacterium TaxID=2609290 RepID=UPI00301AE00C